MNLIKSWQEKGFKGLWRDLPLSFLLFSGLIIFFAKLANEIREKETLPFDVAVLKWIQQWHSTTRNIWVVNLTNTSGAIGMLIIMLAVLLYLARKKDFQRVGFFLSAMGGTFILNLVLKQLFQRNRPMLWHAIVVEKSFSFPSGHAMASSALVFSLLIMFALSKRRYGLITFGLLYILVIGFTRLYLGVHYPTDIAGGWLVSLAWVTLVAHLFNRHGHAPWQ
ncbi:phosphatase PAP2 family protein [Vaginisenegalia massiliensis]|uniref:phosphatase PAP2 family protein n=1 Tax=Vaginisenegalia massiliensis TaxID=2058294 RepID=UPI000F51D4C0|nr:phosphatase PAP2 family protein [Vaginisenegalia massiliensis]